MHGLLRGLPPALDLTRERALHHLLVRLGGSRGAIRSAHDCADGGFAVALAECCFDTQGVGVRRGDRPRRVRRRRRVLAATLFGESASRVIVSASPERTQGVLDAARTAGVPASGDRPDRRRGHSDYGGRRAGLEQSGLRSRGPLASGLPDWLDGNVA